MKAKVEKEVKVLKKKGVGLLNYGSDLRWDYDMPMSEDIVPFAEFSSENWDVGNDAVNAIVRNVFY